ncbi:hypothetical protein KAR26_03825, partial [Candidatus Parcubacteria bacterium]|nr:hypothetical protein [Candidatus Parcubacteria bacterium]
IQQLQAQIAQLQQQLAGVSDQPAAWCHDFNKNLRIGDSGNDVQALENALAKEGFSLTEHSSNFSAVFDERMASSVVGFQEKYASEILSSWGLKHGTGYVGGTTRDKLNKIYGCGAVVPLPPVTPITPTCHTTPLWNWEYCSPGCQCIAGEGDCDTNSDCITGYCAHDVGAKYGQIARMDVCEEKQEKSLTVLSPNGGEKWIAGQTYDITWSAPEVDKINIFLVDDRAGRSYQEIALEVSASFGKYSWVIPDEIGLSSTHSPCFKIWIHEMAGKAGTGGITDESNDYFNIVEHAAPSENLPTSNLNAWLLTHSNIANSIKWQNQPADRTNVYVAPTESDKVAWIDWTQSQKNDLEQAYVAAYDWLTNGAPAVPVDYNGLTDQPTNLQANINNDSVSVSQHVSSAYMWKLYIDNIGFSLAIEIAEQVPWTITTYSDEALRYLFDSSTMAWNIYNGDQYTMGTYYNRVPLLRSSNLPETAFAPAMWTYGFMESAHLTNLSKLDTIGSVLDWMRLNMSHFFGNQSYGNYDAVWQYRGFSPLSKIVNGTVDRNNPEYGTQHWTAGCHGSVGFLSATLRSVNIPVQPVWICGHELAYFITENRYLSHGDDPYNQNTKDAQTAGISLLIDETTYKNWFTSDSSVNITDYQSPACANIGRACE